MTTKLTEMQVAEFEEVLASKSPAPGGGSVAALSGALGAALVRMVTSLTLGREQYAEHEELLRGILCEAAEHGRELMLLVDEDTAAFNTVSAAFAMPKSTTEEKRARAAEIQRAMKVCTDTPYRIMRSALETLRVMRRLDGRYNELTKSDFGVAALSLKAAAQGAWLNILINTGTIHDEVFVCEYLTNGKAMLDTAESIADELYEAATRSLRYGGGENSDDKAHVSSSR